MCGDQSEIVYPHFKDFFPDYNIIHSALPIEEIKEKITTEQIACAFAFDGMTKYTYYVNNLSMSDANTYVAEEAIREAYKINAMKESGLTDEEILEIVSVSIFSDFEVLGKDQSKNFFYTYIMIMALYMVIVLYGQIVATNVATEKSSRAMELLITSAKPVHMMFGKVLASTIAGFIQLSVVFGSALVCFRINKELWADNEIVSSFFDIPLEIFIFMLVFFILGFAIYAFMYGAVGSTVSKVEDVSTAIMPITFLFVISFFIVLMGITSGNVDTTLMKIASIIPFTSPIAMFTRISMSEVSNFEVISSIIILIISSGIIGYLAANIYRTGVLLYGSKPKITTVLKMIFLKNGKK